MKRNSIINLGMFVYFLILTFIFTSPWFSPDCSTTTHGDLENHFITSLTYQEQLLTYGRVFPITFNYFPLGYYHFSYSPVAFLLPVLLRIFFNPRLSFLVVYNLLYALSGLFLFIFLRRNKGNLKGSFLFSTLFLLSGFMNQQFMIHGSYHTIAAIPFFFLTMIYLQKCVSSKKPKKVNILLFVIFSSLTMLMHFFMLIGLFFVVSIYLFLNKRIKLLLFFLIGIMLGAFYYVPIFAQQIILSNITEDLGFSFDFNHLIEIFSFSTLIPEVNEQGLTGTSDFYYGPYYFIGFLIAILYLKIRKPKDKLKLVQKEGLVFSIVISAIILIILNSYLNLIPKDRVSFFFEFSLFLITAFVFSKSEFKLEIPALLLIFTLSSYFLTSLYPYLLALTIAVSVLFIIDSISDKKFSFRKFSFNYFIAFIVVFILFLPFTNFVPSSLNYPRAWCAYLPNTTFIGSNDLVMFDESIYFGYSVGYLTNSNIANNIGHTTLLKDVPTASDSEVFVDFLNRAGVNTLLQFSSSDENTVLFYIQGMINHFLVDRASPAPPRYSIIFNNPVDLNVKFNDTLDRITLRIHYHPWWRAFNNSVELNVSQDDWFLSVSGLTGLSGFRLVFDTFYFNLGLLISLVSLIISIFLILNGTIR